MKKSILLFVLAGLGFLSPCAQVILRYTPSTGEGEVYTHLDLAYEEAQDDDILYLSGNTFQFSVNALDKRLHWIGAGVMTDSTMATGYTKITPTNTGVISFILRPAAGGSSFSGINFGGFRLNDCDEAGEVSLVTFSRCRFMSDWISLSFTSNFVGSHLHYRFQECVFDTYVTGNGFMTDAVSNITFDHCLFSKGLFRLRTGVYNFHHCVFWASTTDYYIGQNTGCNFYNSIFWDAASANLVDGSYMASGNVFDHCVFSHATIPVGGSGPNPTVVSSCLAGVTDLFVETNGNYTFEDSDDYHLVPGSLALTAAADEGECGVYGGESPAKPGLVPYNPHVSAKNIALSTVNGVLHINFTTSAQNH